MQESKFKELEILFCWGEFYSNSKNLAVPTNQDKEKINQVKKQINDLKQQIID